MRGFRAPNYKELIEKSYSRFLPQNVMGNLGGNRTYYYAYGITPGGKIVYWGPMTETDAEDAASGLIDGEIFALQTRDLSKATQAMKADLLKRGKNPDVALSRVSHKMDESLRRRYGIRTH